MSINHEYFVRDSKIDLHEKEDRQIVLYFGNPLVEEDRMALEVGRLLKKKPELEKYYKFVECLKPEDFFDEITSGSVIILDVAENTEQIHEILDPDLLSIDRVYSAHQQNLSFYLKLFKAIGDITAIRILTIPIQGKPDLFAAEISELLLKTIPNRKKSI